MTQDSELHRAVGRVEGQLNTVIEILKSGDTEKRLRAVEGKQRWYSGAAAAVGVLAAFIFKH